MKGSKAMNNYIRQAVGLDTETEDPESEILAVANDTEAGAREAAKKAKAHKQINAVIRAAYLGGND